MTVTRAPASWQLIIIAITLIRQEELAGIPFRQSPL
jgi:hypothetical protein